MRKTLQFTEDQLRPLSFDLPPAEPVSMVKLRLGAVPKSRVYIDGRYIGMTPIYGHKVATGSHVVEFRTSRLKASFKKRISASGGSQRVFHRFKMGKLWVLSRPAATIYLNGVKLGRSNRPPYQIPAGTYFLRLVSNNGRSVNKRGVIVRSGRKTSVRKIIR